MIPQTSCPFTWAIARGESEQGSVKNNVKRRVPAGPNIRLLLLKSGHCLSALEKKQTTWRKWAGHSRELEPADQPVGWTQAE